MAIYTAAPLLKERRTKIVATLGPSSRDPETIRQLILAGANLFRLNMSHGDHAEHGLLYDRVRTVASSMRQPIAVLADLSGPKIRVGKIDNASIELQKGAQVTVTTRQVTGKQGLIPSQYAALHQDVIPGARLLLADGVMELTVDSIEGTEVKCTVTQGGTLKQGAGINLPDVEISAPSFTEKDRADARFAISLGVDLLALSFVRRASELQELKALIRDQQGDLPQVIAKIERPEALRNSEEIIAAADSIMVARGDLGVELPPEQVPVVQRQLVDQAIAHNKPVIIATQMLESMIDHARPTRAEVADISLSVSSGVDALMLSGETAVGSYPVQTVQMTDRVARQTEGYLWHQGAFGSFATTDGAERPLPYGDAVADATALLSRDLRVRTIVVISETGTSAVTVSSARPAAPVIAISTNERTFRRMSLLWGVIPMLVDTDACAQAVMLARRVTKECQLANPGHHILLVRGFHSEPDRNAPSITVLNV